MEKARKQNQRERQPQGILFKLFKRQSHPLKAEQHSTGRALKTDRHSRARRRWLAVLGKLETRSGQYKRDMARHKARQVARRRRLRKEAYALNRARRMRYGR